MIELHLRGRVAPGRRAELVAFLAEAIPFYEQPGGIRAVHDRDQLRVEQDPRMRGYLERWRVLLNEPVQVETYRADTPRV